jgi:hypothetical protein
MTFGAFENKAGMAAVSIFFSTFELIRAYLAPGNGSGAWAKEKPE